LPVPSTGDLVRIADNGTWNTTNLTVAPHSGGRIETLAINETLVLDISGIIIDFVYDGTTWEIFTSSGTTGALFINDSTTNSTFYPTFVSGTGNQVPYVRTTSTAFSFNPNTCALTAVDFNATSDSNLKTNIKPIENALDKIQKLNGITFNWKENNRPSVGIIAQEVESIFPELVSEVNGEKTVNYNGLIGLIIESIKEINNKI
jgi:hypothetical protein